MAKYVGVQDMYVLTHKYILTGVYMKRQRVQTNFIHSFILQNLIGASALNCRGIKTTAGVGLRDAESPAFRLGLVDLRLKKPLHVIFFFTLGDLYFFKFQKSFSFILYGSSNCTLLIYLIIYIF